MALIYFSDSPTYFDIKSELLTDINMDSDYVAQALAKKVLPVPGGPYKSIPFQGYLMPMKISGNFIGKIIVSFNYRLATSNPATSSHLILGFSLTIASSINFLPSSFS